MGSIDDIEAQLLEGFEPELLAIYADALLAEGDPRGELVAFDAHATRVGPEQELAQRVRDTERQWLGELAGEPGIQTRFGFLDLTLTAGAFRDRVLRALTGPRGALVRTLRIELPDAARARRVLELVASQPRPWLTRLAIAVDDDEPIADGALSAALVRATPRLRTLHLAKAAMVGFAHPGLRRLRLDGLDALPALTRPGAAFASLVELDLDATFAEVASAKELLPHARLPALRCLDISRIAYVHDEAVELIRRRPLVSRLTHLRVGHAHMRTRAWYRSVLDGAPALRELRIAKRHDDVVEVPDDGPPVTFGPALHLRALPIDSHATWLVEHDGLALPLHDLLGPMRVRFINERPLPTASARTIGQLVRVLEELTDEDATSVLVGGRYLAELVGFSRTLDERWRPVVEALEDHPELVARIRRYWP